jgi:ketosteroid isomerase-like protein
MPRFTRAKLIALFSIALHTPALAQQPPSHSGAIPGLRSDILAADKALFDRFNAHDLAGTMRGFTSDVEFYHDLGGLQHYADLAAGFRGNFAKNNGLRRELVAGSLEVYPIPDYGAMEVGAHRFCHAEAGREECAVFRFVHVWRKTAEGWKISRAISYGH